MSALTVGAEVATGFEGGPFTSYSHTARTEEWAVALGTHFDFMSGTEVPVLDIWHNGVHEAAVGLVDPVGPGTLAVWGDTALVGDQLVELKNRDVFTTDPATDCLDLAGAALADGVLALNNPCTGELVTIPVPEDGISAADLSVDNATTVLDQPGYQLSLSRGLLVFAVAEPNGIGWDYLFDADPAVVEQDAAAPPIVATRLHGERAVFVMWDGDPHTMMGAFVFDLAAFEVQALIFMPPPMDGLEGSPDVPLADCPPWEETSEMHLGHIPIDLFGRTIAWWDGTAIVAATLPPLADGDPGLSAPSSGTAGKSVSVAGSGFFPDEEIAIWLTSDPVLLGQGYATAAGTFSGTVTLPAGTVTGLHTVTLVGVDSGWSAARPISVLGRNAGLEVRTG